MDLSIIIPAYNVQDYIRRCLDSVSCFPETLHMECLIIDDGSTDLTPAIVEQCSSIDSRLRLISQKNAGVSAARNRGLQEAQGQYIMFLDADDYLAKGAYEHICQVIRDENAEFAAFGYMTLYGDGRFIPQPLPIREEVSHDLAEGNRLMYADSVFNTCWGKLFLQRIIHENKLTFRMDLPIGEDFLFVAQYYSLCRTIYMSQYCLLYYLQRSGSAMRSYSMEKRLEFTEILYTYNKDIVRQYKDDGLYEQMSVYYVKVLTNLMLEYARCLKHAELRKAYDAALHTDAVRQILNAVKPESISSRMKHMEYRMLCRGNVGQMAIYFRIKSKFRR